MTIRLGIQIPNFSYGTGADGVILSPVTSLSGYHPGAATAVAEKLKPLLSG